MKKRYSDEIQTIIEPEFLVYPSKNIVPIYGFLSLLALGFGIYLAMNLVVSLTIVTIIPLSIAIMALFYYLQKIRVLSPTNRPFFSLNQKGIEVRAIGFAPWSDIRRAYIKTRVNKYHYLVIEYKSPTVKEQDQQEYFLERRYYDHNYDKLKAQLQLYAQKYITQ